MKKSYYITDFSLILSIFLLIILSKLSYFSFIFSFFEILSSIFLSVFLYLFRISGVLKFSVKSNIFFHYQLIFYMLMVLSLQTMSYINRLYKNVMACFSLITYLKISRFINFYGFMMS